MIFIEFVSDRKSEQKTKIYISLWLGFFGRSILNLWGMLGLKDQTAEEANEYYIDRLKYLAKLWDKVPAENRVHIDHSEFSSPHEMVEKTE